MSKKILMACTFLVAVGVGGGGAWADELSDLREQLKSALQRIDQLEAKAAQSTASQTGTPAAQGPAPQAASRQAASDQSPGAGQAPAKTALSLTTPTGFEWNIYGRGDIGFVQSIGSTGNGKAVVTNRFNQGEMASRLGLTGSWAPNNNDEYKAIFAVETGLNLFNGSAGGTVQNYSSSTSVLFNRGATAGIASKTYGSIEGGTMYMAPFWVILGADQASAHDYGANDFSALFSLSRPEALARYLKDPVTGNVSGTTSMTGGYSGTALFYANSIRYRTPNFSGFTGEFSYSMGQQAFGSTEIGADGRTYAGNIMYNNGPLFIGYAHQDYIQENDIAVSGASNWVSRDQTTDVIGARYKWGDLEFGASYTLFQVSNAGGYMAQAYGLSSSYDIGPHRIETSLAKITYGGVNNTGSYGKNTGDGSGKPESVSLGAGYLYNIAKNWSAYTYYNHIFNNTHAKLGTLSFRSDNSSTGFSPTTWTVGMFYCF